ncbi:Porin [Phaeobacter sp. CECT 5382]|uniref:porin n=1 Tax=Phaeobacter sp. CECT 5382 TaxID=1712645 RepID=UPI0006DB81F4|nr:porin [Phaeobacter sp. CECT 5382]CUH86720.1 Porin [Phaeobacter sp. CECT 5382]
MKKVLFATTALIATAGMAAAEVSMSGYGRFGLDYNSANGDAINADGSANAGGVSETNITSRLRLQFDMSTEADNGVGFNARYRAQAESRDGVAGTGAFNGARFGVTYGGLAVNVGNIIGAVENTPGLYVTGARSAGTGIDGMGFHSLAIKSSSALGVVGTRFNWDAYSSAGAGSNGIEALYSTGGFTGHISYSQRNGGAVVGDAGGEQRTAVMVTYSFSDYYVAASYQATDNSATITTTNGTVLDPNDGLYLLTAGGDFGAFGAKLAYGSTDVADSVTLEGNMDIGAASNIVVWVNSTDVDANLMADTTVTGATTIGANATASDGTSFGINYQYDLGGGATFVAGYVDEADDDNQFQAGVYFSF